MFLVFRVDKICAYIVAVCTVVVLFASALFLPNTEILQTAARAQKSLPIYSVNTTEKKVALTLNCAWNADDIDLILQTLKKYNVRITFFMVGDWVDKYPEQVKKISKAGHEIANHSLSHAHVNQLDYKKNVEQIVKCSEKIEKITGKKTTLYRGPYGEYNDTVIKAAEDNNHTVIQWSIDTLDYQDLTTEQMWNRIKEKLTNGSIILMHNGTKNTATSLDTIIKSIQSSGYEIVTVSNLIYKDNYTIDNNGTQHKN